MAGVAVILFNANCSGFTDDMAFWGKYASKGIPIICIESAFCQVLDFVVKLLEGCSITIADHPGKGSPCATIQGLDDPFFVFFEPTKCHISSNSISLILPSIAGSAVRSIASTIQRYIKERECPNSFPSILKDALPIAYKITLKAFFTAVLGFLLSSPFTKLNPHFPHRYRCFPLTLPFLITSWHSHFLHAITSTPSILFFIHSSCYKSIFLSTLSNFLNTYSGFKR